MQALVDLAKANLETRDTHRKLIYASLASVSAAPALPVSAAVDCSLRSAQYFFIRSEVAFFASSDMLRRLRAGFSGCAGDLERPGLPPSAAIAASTLATRSSNSARSV